MDRRATAGHLRVVAEARPALRQLPAAAVATCLSQTKSLSLDFPVACSLELRLQPREAEEGSNKLPPNTYPLRFTCKVGGHS